MKYAMLILDTPVIDGSSLAVLSNYARDVASIAGQSAPIQMLNIGCYLVNVGSGLNALGVLVAVARERRLPHRTLFFEDEPAFVITRI